MSKPDEPSGPGEPGDPDHMSEISEDYYEPLPNNEPNNEPNNDIPDIICKNNENTLRDNPIYSPELIIEPAQHGHKTFNVIRDDYLTGGSKQRGMVPLLLNSPMSEFVYAGPNSGYAQIALAYAAQITKKNCTLFVAKTKRDHPCTIKAKQMGANVIRISKGYLENVRRAADKYVLNHSDAELVPFGGDSSNFIEYMVENIQNALPDSLRENPPRRMWLVGGSGTLL